MTAINPRTEYRVGDSVECQTAHGEWFPATVSGPVQYVKFGKTRCLALPITGQGWHHVNWPIEHVRPATTPGAQP